MIRYQRETRIGDMTIRKMSPSNLSKPTRKRRVYEDKALLRPFVHSSHLVRRLSHFLSFLQAHHVPRHGLLTSAHLETECRSKQKLHHGKGNWLAVSVLILSVYSTSLSGLWLGAAIAKPRFGHGITSTGKFPLATASLVAAGIAKSIELSFVTVFVTFLGQVLSRRALIKRSRGITISEMSMRQWIMQPGTLITHWQAVRYAALTLLGMISLLGALTAMFYTTASDALVAPKLKTGNSEHRHLYGHVGASFANEVYIQNNCQTPISQQIDPEFSGSTCIAIEHSGQAYVHHDPLCG